MGEKQPVPHTHLLASGVLPGVPRLGERLGVLVGVRAQVVEEGWAKGKLERSERSHARVAPLVGRERQHAAQHVTREGVAFRRRLPRSELEVVRSELSQLLGGFKLLVIHGEVSEVILRVHHLGHVL